MGADLCDGTQPCDFRSMDRDGPAVSTPGWLPIVENPRAHSTRAVRHRLVENGRNGLARLLDNPVLDGSSWYGISAAVAVMSSESGSIAMPLVAVKATCRRLVATTSLGIHRRNDAILGHVECDVRWVTPNDGIHRRNDAILGHPPRDPKRPVRAIAQPLQPLQHHHYLLLPSIDRFRGRPRAGGGAASGAPPIADDLVVRSDAVA